MNAILNIFTGVAAGAVISATSYAATAEWGTDFAQGLAEAAKGDRLVLVDFTGSDWCSACKLLDAKVLTDKAFSDFAAKNKLVLVQLDYPNGEGLVTPEQKNIRREIADRYAIRAYPTLLVVDSQGSPYGRVEGFYGTAQRHIELLQAVLDVRKAHKRGLNAARKLPEGVSRAEALNDLLNKLPEAVRPYHRALVEEIMQNDKDDTLGYHAGQQAKDKQNKQLDEVKAALKAAVGDRPFMAAIDDARAAAHQLLAREDLLPFVRLSLNAYLSQSYVLQGNMQEALKYMDIAIDSDPECAEAKEMREKGRPMLLETIKKLEEARAKQQ